MFALWLWTLDQTWAARQPDGHFRLGITPLGLKASGELYMCRPKAVGQRVEQGKSMAVVELAKSIVSVKAPLSGVVVAVNEAVVARPESVLASPCDEGWLVEIEASDFEAESQQLLTDEAAQAAMVEWARLNNLEWP